MSKSYHRTTCFISLLALGCASAPPAPTPVRTPISVAASFTKTWDAVIDVFAAKNIPIKNMDRSSGFISTEEMQASPTGEAKTYADCGRSMFGARPPTHANYNIRVKGDSSRSTVQVTVMWKEVYPQVLGGQTEQCPTKGIWETEAESEIKTRAETR